MKHTTTGIAVELDGKYWGKIYEDGYSTGWGWIGEDLNDRITSIEIANDYPRISPLKPEHFIYEGSHYISELKKGRLVKVTRTITIEQEALTIKETV